MRERIEEVIEKINIHYGKIVIIDNGDGSYYNRFEKLDTSEENVRRFGERIERESYSVDKKKQI